VINADLGRDFNDTGVDVFGAPGLDLPPASTTLEVHLELRIYC
jgi:hypothetical protein